MLCTNGMSRKVLTVVSLDVKNCLIGLAEPPFIIQKWAEVQYLYSLKCYVVCQVRTVSIERYVMRMTLAQLIVYVDPYIL